MKRSRTGTAILVICLLIIGFIAAALVASLFRSTDSEDSTWTDLFIERGNKIGVITLEGTIASADETLKQLRKFRKKKSIKAIVIRINSPGGTVAPAQEIYGEIRKVKEQKPVVASMETVGASAAYYIASATDNVVCSAGTITGSIGVIMMLPDIHSVIQKIGVGVNVIKAGQYKDIGSPLRELTDPEKKILEKFAGDIHEQFIRDVAAGRKGKIDEEKLRSVADGRFFCGEKAKEMGLVDTLGNFYDAVKIACDLGGVKTEPELVYPEKKWHNLLDLVTESASGALVRKLADQARLIQSTPSLQ
jgi:protease IV